MTNYLEMGYNKFLQKMSLTPRETLSSIEAKSMFPTGSISISSLNTPINVTTNIAFSSTDNDTAAWTTGTIYFSNGSNSGTIDAGNTGNIVATTYVYYDKDVLGVLQTTTDPKIATGTNKYLLATVELGAAGKNCKITPTIGLGMTVSGLTTSSLSFTPVDSTNVVASINASNEGIDINGSKIAINGDVTFATGYDPSGKIASGGAAADVNANATTISGGKITTNTLDANAITASDIDVAIGVGDTSKVKLDGANTRIIINDGTNDRILIGNLA